MKIPYKLLLTALCALLLGPAAQAQSLGGNTCLTDASCDLGSICEPTDPTGALACTPGCRAGQRECGSSTRACVASDCKSPPCADRCIDDIDLEISAVTVDDRNLQPLDLLSFYHSIENYGEAVVPSGLRVEYYLSTDSELEEDDLYLGDYTYASPITTDSVTGPTIYARIPGDTAAGLYHFFIVANPDGHIEETDPTNNVFSYWFLIIVEEPGTNKDLSWQPLTTGPSTLRQGEVSSFVLYPAAVGEDNILETFRTSLFLSEDEQYDSNDLLLHSFFTPGTFTPNYPIWHIDVPIPADAPTGPRYLLAIIDDEENVDETNEDNNAIRPRSVQVLPPVECQDGARRCSGDRFQECVLGLWETIRVCTYGCDGDILACMPGPTCSGSSLCHNLGERTCNGFGDVLECSLDSESCLRWAVAEDCSEGCTGGVCNNSACSGTNACSVPDVHRCAALDQVESCRADGQSCLVWSPPSNGGICDIAAGEICSEGACRVFPCSTNADCSSTSGFCDNGICAPCSQDSDCGSGPWRCGSSGECYAAF